MRLITVEYAQTITPDTELRIGYKSTNMGEFFYKHCSTAVNERSELRMTGYYSYEDPTQLEGPIEGCMYEFGGCMCRGSGAEPCWILEGEEQAPDIRRGEGWNDEIQNLIKRPYEA
jgi:hypothetical protein